MSNINDNIYSTQCITNNRKMNYPTTANTQKEQGIFITKAARIFDGDTQQCTKNMHEQHIILLLYWV